MAHASEGEKTVEIGGYDGLVVVNERPQHVTVRILKALVQRWPAAVTLVNDKVFHDGVVPQSLPPGKVFVHVNRDTEMQSHDDRTGGAVMEDGEGPVSLLYDGSGEGPYEVTVVMPADPAANAFSRGVWELVQRSCADSLIRAELL